MRGYTLRHNTMRGTQLPLSTLPNHTWEKGNDVVLPDTDSGLSLLFAYADSARSLRTPPGLISPGRRTADFLSCRTYYSNLLERNFSSAGLACTLMRSRDRGTVEGELSAIRVQGSHQVQGQKSHGPWSINCWQPPRRKATTTGLEETKETTLGTIR